MTSATARLGVGDAMSELRRKIADKRNEIVCDTDEAFLLKFLDRKEFDVDSALASIVKYYNLRKEFPEKIWPRGKGVKWMEPFVALENCTILPMKNPKDNTRIFMWRKGHWNPEEKIFDLADCLTWSLYMTEYFLYMRRNDEEDCAGWTYIMDLSGFTARHIPHCDLQVVRAYSGILAGALPLRVKAIHFLNVPLVFQYALQLIKFLLGTKLRNRVFVHSSREKLTSEVDPSVLPEGYGDSGMKFSSRWIYEEMLQLEDQFEERSYHGFTK
ncbi:alpha-tocopherol transfer protein [Galendromus occidentalis]|uniref:Alpha-tocopherol transfer protein n=1 Tax=Galendromus occidentalis TaxID=34638 RepID=A0AAJ6QSB6_9ACAR|nr:alpha-tocopherol transfer protein [Galendromus occidentalis]